jgi:glycosyltransferase involved in cell wall biosynthesis
VNARPLSILLAGDYPPDPSLGSPKVFYKLQAEFVALGHRCDVVFGPEIGGPDWRQLRQVVAPLNAAKAIVQRLNEQKYDVADIASAEGIWFGAMKQLGLFPRPAYICRSNGLEHLNYRRMLDDARAGLTSKPWSRRIWYPATRLSQVAAAAHLADRLLLLNETDRRFAIDRGWQPPERIDVVAHGVSQQFVDADPGPDLPRGRGILFCGSWDHMKGISYLIAAYEQLHTASTTWPLTILGPGVPPDEVLRSFSPAARSHVTVLPRTSEEHVMQMYREHDLLWWMSTYEGFGLVLLEAMTQRLPVVATPVGCATHLVTDGATGALVPTRDARAIGSATVRLMGDANERRRLAAAARDRVAGMTWRATAKRTLDVYRAALETWN